MLNADCVNKSFTVHYTGKFTGPLQAAGADVRCFFRKAAALAPQPDNTA
jgi:hypothetical protein